MSEVKIAPLVSAVKSAPGLHYKHPRFPVHIKLPDNLECGTKVYIHGATSPDSNRFAFNLKNAEVDANNYFHFNVRFDEGCVVRNSRLDEAWGDEERDGDMPFVQGEPFLITITPNVDSYEVEVNGNPFITYNHRDGMPLCDVTHIHMWGDVTVYGIHVPLKSFPIPLVLRVPKHVFVGDTLVISGEAPAGANRFHVNFQCGPGDDSDIMYHFNPRFDENSVVCNNRCADSWGDEENLGDLPVTAGDRINAAIVATKDGFMPFLNGNRMPQFAHRLDACAACSVVVDGDISLETVTFDCAPVKLPPQVPDIDLDRFDETTQQALRTATPVTMPLPGGFGPGKAVYVSGKVTDDPERFEINLLCGDNDENIAIHVNPRWSYDTDLVMNSRDEENWGDEVRVPNPVSAGSEVEVFLLCNDDGYSVVVDGDVVASYPHLLDCSRVNHVMVDGDIEVHRILGI